MEDPSSFLVVDKDEEELSIVPTHNSELKYYDNEKRKTLNEKKNGLENLIDEKCKEFKVSSADLKMIDSFAEAIGWGSYGVVYVRNFYGYQVAYKKFRNNNYVDEILKEILAMEKLKHPNIVRLFGIVQEPNTFGVVMEYCDGGSLHSRLHGKNINKDERVFNDLEILSIAEGLVGGLSYLHSKGIVHRDLKSENVILRRNGEPVICDFGMATTLEMATQMSTFQVGTLLWMAPEIMRKQEKYDSKCDVYSFAIILWELINGVLPYCDIPASSIIKLVGFDGHRSPMLIREDRTAPEEIKKLIRMCWDQSPNKRPRFDDIVQLKKGNSFIDCILDSRVYPEQDLELESKFQAIQTSELASRTRRKSIMQEIRGLFGFNKTKSEPETPPVTPLDLHFEKDFEAREFWKKRFSEKKKPLEHVAWISFLGSLSKHLNMNKKQKIFHALKMIMVKDGEKVTMESFGNILKWFGPFMDRSVEKPISFLDKMGDLFEEMWFHGDISKEIAQTRLAGSMPGTFLIRLSSVPGYFAVSQMNKENKIIHMRVEHSDPSGDYIVMMKNETKVCPTLHKLVQSLGLDPPCNGSYYYAQFKLNQANLGYVTRDIGSTRSSNTSSRGTNNSNSTTSSGHSTMDHLKKQ